MSANKAASTSLRMSSAILIFSLMTCCSSSTAIPLSRYERQTITNELASGLSDTGTSFSPSFNRDIYGGSYPQQEIYGNRYADGIYNTPQVADDPYLPGYTPVKTDGWRGFGVGKNPVAPRPPSSYQWGVKY